MIGDLVCFWDVESLQELVPRCVKGEIGCPDSSSSNVGSGGTYNADFKQTSWGKT